MTNKVTNKTKKIMISSVAILAFLMLIFIIHRAFNPVEHQNNSTVPGGKGVSLVRPHLKPPTKLPVNGENRDSSVQLNDQLNNLKSRVQTAVQLTNPIIRLNNVINTPANQSSTINNFQNFQKYIQTKITQDNKLKPAQKEKYLKFTSHLDSYIKQQKQNILAFREIERLNQELHVLTIKSEIAAQNKKIAESGADIEKSNMDRVKMEKLISDNINTKHESPAENVSKKPKTVSLQQTLHLMIVYGPEKNLRAVIKVNSKKQDIGVGDTLMHGRYKVASIQPKNLSIISLENGNVYQFDREDQ